MFGVLSGLKVRGNYDGGHGMSSVLLFGGRSLLDQTILRENFLRIPEVSRVLRDAQKELEALQELPFDIFSFATSEDKTFHSNIPWKELVVQLFQIGLFQRLQKTALKTKFMIGNSVDTSAVDVCLGKKTLSNLILKFVEDLNAETTVMAHTDVLVGQKLELSKLYVLSEGVYVESLDGKSAQGLLDELSKDYLIDQIIVLGSTESVVLETSLSHVMDSLALDPLLSWMFPRLQSA